MTPQAMRTVALQVHSLLYVCTSVAIILRVNYHPIYRCCPMCDSAAPAHIEGGALPGHPPTTQATTAAAANTARAMSARATRGGSTIFHGP